MQQWLTNAIENAEIHKTSPGDYGYPLKGTFLRKSLWDFALHVSLDENYGPPTHLYFFTSPLEKLWIFKLYFNINFEVLLHKMGSPDFNLVAVTRMQIITIHLLSINISTTL
jgi:hypothetical protein